MDITNGWFYESCPKCWIKLMLEKGKFTCDDDGTVTPEFVMQLNLMIQDEIAKIEAVMFAKDPTESEVEYVFIIGKEMMGTDAGEKREPREMTLELFLQIAMNQLLLLMLFPLHSHHRKREGSIPLDVPDSPCIPHDLFDTDSPNKRSRQDQDCEEIMKGKK
ncbi:Nucleic acid-binding protein [Corchorus olitorius]|uniref:Nucleic acid-binding protein n=1 Tax=Corchorus olitorius TaxID=93759 RepID=A0A1R3J0M2_9ROSI|nr:Nucleic acid-binding protein [Corchorus olitorius]